MNRPGVAGKPDRITLKQAGGLFQCREFIIYTRPPTPQQLDETRSGESCPGYFMNISMHLPAASYRVSNNLPSLEGGGTCKVTLQQAAGNNKFKA
jgi:hypothetical protein